jgi:DNA-binding transcriptional ArsR family regulator
MHEMNDPTIDKASALIKVLADRTRLRILAALTAEELSVSDLQRRLGISQPLTSFHLSVLGRVGLVKHRRDAQWTHYRLDHAGWNTAMRTINAVFDPKDAAD